jgi:gliding motility-associated-like protein
MKLPVHFLFILVTLGSFAQTSRNGFPAPDTVSADSLSILKDIPNVFTPNNDGVNDAFTISGSGIETINLQIYDRWGTKIYEFFGPNDHWDGRTTSGAACQPGVYYFFMTASGADGASYQQKGTIQLLR